MIPTSQLRSLNKGLAQHCAADPIDVVHLESAVSASAASQGAVTRGGPARKEIGMIETLYSGDRMDTVWVNGDPA